MIVLEVNYCSIKELIIQYHYLHRTPAGILMCFALYENDNLINPIGAIVYCNGRIQYNNKFIEFSRMYLFDEIPFNSESYFIGKSLKMLYKKFPKYLGVVTWADTEKGHLGTVYKATNFAFDGVSRKTKKYKSLTGKTIYERTVTNEQKNNLLCEKVETNKLRFIYYFDKKKRESLRSTKENDG